MTKLELYKLMKDLPSQANHYTRIEDIVCGVIMVLCFFLIFLIGYV
jgi:hypothetical protein